VLRLAGQLTTMLTLTNPASRQLRDHVMPILGGLGVVQHQIAVQDSQLDITYRASPIVDEYHQGHFGHARFVGGPRAGERTPDVGPLRPADGSAQRLHELLRGTQHTLLLFGGPAPQAATWQQLTALADDVRAKHREDLRVYFVVDGANVPDQLAGQSGVLLDAEGAAHHRYQADRACLYLVRPDNYVGFVSRPPDQAALTTYLGRIFR